MPIYGTALLSLCLLTGLTVGRLIGAALGVDADIGGVGIAAVGVGSYFGLRASSTWKQAKDACPGLTGCPDNRGNDLGFRLARGQGDD